MDGNIMLAVPTRGTVAFQVVEQLNKIRDASSGLDPIRFVCDSLSVVRTRNKIVAEFLNSRKEVLAMVDDDVVPILQFLNLERTLHYAEDFGMIGVPYPTYDPRVGFHMTAYKRVIDGIQPLHEFRDELNEVDVLATGCVMIRREALLSIASDGPWFSFEDDSDLSEDVIFCDDLRRAGWKIGCWIGEGFSDHVRTMPLGMPYLAQSAQYSTRV